MDTPQEDPRDEISTPLADTGAVRRAHSSRFGPETARRVDAKLKRQAGALSSVPSSQPQQEPKEKRRGPSPAFAVLLLLGISLLVAPPILLMLRPSPTAIKQTKASQPVVDEASQAEAAAQIEASKQPVTIDLVMAGDILLHDAIVDVCQLEDGSYDFNSLFANVKDEITAADVAIVNQETSLAGPDLGYYGEVDIPLYSEEEVEAMGGPWWMYVVPLFNSPDAVADAEVAAGFDVILKAQNHVFDQGYSGLVREMKFWTDTYPQINVLGVADPTDESGAPDRVHDVYIYEKDGFKVAILNYTDFYNTRSGDEDYERAAYLSDYKVAEDVAQARAKGADMIVACPHWGTEYLVYPDDSQTYYAQVMANAGVDVIFGTHPHVPENVEVLTGDSGNTCVCFYSNGNFVTANTTLDCMLTGLSKVTLEKAADGTCRIARAQFLPCVVHGGYGAEMTTYLLSDYTEDLAATNWEPALTKAFADERFAEILGEGFDSARSIYTVALPENPLPGSVVQTQAEQTQEEGEPAQEGADMTQEEVEAEPAQEEAEATQEEFEAEAEATTYDEEASE